MSIIKNTTEILGNMFSFGPKNLVGVDIGLSSVKVCEMQKIKKDKFKFLRFGIAPLPEGCLIEDEIQKPDEIIKAIKIALGNAGIKNKNVCIGLFGPNTIVKRLQLAVSDPNEIEDQVIWESEQYIPFGIDDSEVSFHILGKNAGGGTDVLVGAARQDIIGSYKGLVEQADVKVKVVDLNVFAACNVLEIAKKDELAKDPSAAVIFLNLGAQFTTLFIYKLDSIVYSREIAIGGDIITEEIQRQMGLNHLEAEDLKTQGDESGNLPQEILEIMEVVLESFYEEIKKTIDFFVTASAEENIAHCYVTGGSSRVPGLLEGLTQVLGVPSDYFNPFERIDYNKRVFDDAMIENISSVGSVAMGLAMREND